MLKEHQAKQVIRKEEQGNQEFSDLVNKSSTSTK